MRKSSLLYLGLGLVILLWWLNLIALKFYFYWTLGWYDYMMHFLGGFTLSILGVWLWGSERSLKSFLIVFLGVMILAIGFEIFEYLNNLNYLIPQNYITDTTHDLIAGAFGAALAYWLATSLPQ